MSNRLPIPTPFNGRNSGDGIRPIFRLLLTAAFLAATLGCFAQPLRPQLSLTVAEAVTRGLAVSEEARLAASQTRETATGVSVALSGVLPEVNGQFQYTRTIRTLFSIPGFDNIPLPLGQANGYNMSIAVAQPIYRPGAWRGIQIAKDYLKTARDQESESRLDLVLRICQSYYDTVLANSLAAISQAQVDQLEAQLRDVQLQRQAGNASDLDVLRVQVNRDNIAPQLVAVINSRDDALFALRQLLNIEKNTDLVLADQLSADGFRPVEETELATLVRNALETRASVRAAKRLASIREAQVKQAREAYLPSLDAVGQLGEQAYPRDFFPNNRDFIDSWSVGFQINIPLFSSGRRKAQVKAAQERAQQAWLQLELVKESVESQAEEAQRELRRSADLVATRTRTTTQAARVFELTELAYKQGAAGHLELDDARLNLRQSRSNETQAVHDYYVFYLRLLRLVGVPAESFTSANSLSSHKQTIGKQPGTP